MIHGTIHSQCVMKTPASEWHFTKILGPSSNIDTDQIFILTLIPDDLRYSEYKNIDINHILIIS